MYIASVGSNFVRFSDSDNHTIFCFHCTNAESHFVFDLTLSRLILIVVHQSSFRYYSLDEKDQYFDYHQLREEIHDYYAKTLLNVDRDNHDLCEYINQIVSNSKKQLDWVEHRA